MCLVTLKFFRFSSFHRSDKIQSTEIAPQDQEYKFSGIRKRRCRRYIPVEPDEHIREFLRDRYRLTNIKGTPPSGPLCACGLQREEHKKDAIDAAPPDVAFRERDLADSAWHSCGTQYKRTNAPKNEPKLPEHVNQLHSPTKLVNISQATAWNVLSDTVEEPTDVDFELPISSKQQHDESLNTESIIGSTMNSSLGHAQRVLIL